MNFGVFSDEGLICDDFPSAEAARAWAATEASGCADDETIKIAEVCHDHPDHAADTCEECAIGDGEE